MDLQFRDRILSCADCHTDFIFTAGEQLFFHDKQFKNDPKRCKPCKSRRSGLSAAATGVGLAAAGLSRTETRTECSDCGIETTVPFKPTQGRPVLCRQCFQAKGQVAKSTANGHMHGDASMTVAQAASALTSVSANADGAVLCADAAILAAASMAGAPANSMIATASDLASIAAIPQPGPSYSPSLTTSLHTPVDALICPAPFQG